MRFLYRMFGYDPIKIAERIEDGCSKARLPHDNYRLVAARIRQGKLWHPAAISKAIETALRLDYEEAKGRGLF